MTIRKTVSRWAGEVLYRLKPGRVATERAVDIPAFHALGPGDLAIDCGANLGLITRILAEHGAEVHAFEPNPDAFRALERATAAFPNVIRHQKAVLDAPGRMILHHHLNYHLNPERFSSRSSLYGEKRNVDGSRGTEVEVIDLAEFIRGLDRPVSLLKLDIEGAEYAVIDKLIATGLIDRVGLVFAETHAHSIASLRPAHDRLVRTIEAKGLQGKIDLNWK
ncbi:MAG: FkbM family methyltransferase [Rhodobacteraceae bacterium]|nr:FkbM family methyltransferase [Paracoccaceae bacterium]